MDYRFMKDGEKDPIIDLMRGEIDLEEYGAIAKLSAQSSVSETTLRNWFFGETRRPQNITVRMVLQALNCRVKIFRQDGTEVRGPRHHDKSNGRKSQKVPAEAARAAQ